MKNFRFALVALALVVAAVIESTWLTLVGLPGAVPPLTLMAVLALALRRSPANAAVVGFLAGLLMDVIPPSTTPMGVSAGAFAIVAFFVSGLRTYIEGSAILPLAAAAGSAAAAIVIRFFIAVTTGVAQNLTDNLFGNLITSAVYGAILAVAVWPAMQWFDRFVTPRVTTTIVR
jgi:rod shape-determining protein MreD